MTSTTHDSSFQASASQYGSMGETLSKNVKYLIAGIVSILILAAGWTLVKSQQDKKSEAARSALFSAQKSLDESLKALAAIYLVERSEPLEHSATIAEAKPQKEQTKTEKEEAKKKTPPVDVDSLQFKKFDVDAKLSAPIAKLKSVIDAYPGTRSAHEARMTLGSLYMNHGEADKAAPWYKFATESAPDSMEKALAFSGWAYALESTGKTQEALDAYQKALNQGVANLQGDLLLGIARSYQKLNQAAQARSTYEKISSQLPNTDYSRTADSLKALLP